MRYFLYVLLCMIAIDVYSNLRDPTRPIAYDSGELTTGAELGINGFKVEGLFISKSKRVALINGAFLVVGDMTSKGKLVAIFKDRVVLKEGEIMQVVFMINQKVRLNK